MNLLTRIFNWLHRFSLAIKTMGFFNGLKIFLSQYVGVKMQRVSLPDKSQFYFSPSLDKVVSHFFSLGYLISDGNHDQIKRIIDAGANIGVETARFSVHHPKAHIVAIEAKQRNFDILKRNASERQNVFVEFAGVWPVKTHLNIESTSDDMQAFKVSSSTVDSNLESITIPEILRKYKWDAIDILKLDIEGAEHPLFTQGDLDWIQKVNVFIIEIGDQDSIGMTQAIFSALSSMQYNSFLCGENLVLIKSDLDWKLERVIGFKS